MCQESAGTHTNVPALMALMFSWGQGRVLQEEEGGVQTPLLCPGPVWRAGA